ncbi:hypothetical protein HDU78_010457 [Chytriomyces hyalinus]|nr:hypothetical protein HDU78_010457 [Chytriomyces hyalinus]
MKARRTHIARQQRQQRRQRVADAGSSIKRSRTLVSIAESSVSTAENDVKNWTSKHPEYTGKEPGYNARVEALEKARAYHLQLAALGASKRGTRKGHTSVNISLKEAFEQLSSLVMMENDTPTQNVFTAQDSMDNLPLLDNVLTLDIKLVKGVPNFLYSDRIYADEATIGINMPVDKLLKIDKQTIILIGVSGCGKTRTCYDYARHHWCLYFDCTEDPDILSMIDGLEDEIPDTITDRSQKAFEAYSKKAIKSLIAARLLVLRILREKPNYSPFDWHCVQRSMRSRRLFKLVFLQLVTYPQTVVSRMFEQLTREFDGRIMFDESQDLLTTLETDYRSSKGDRGGITDNELDFPRSLFSFATHNVIKWGLKSIWCGTHMRIRNVDLVFPAAGGEKDTDIHLFTDFSYLQPSAIRKLCSRWIQPHIYENNQTLFEEISNFLQGRPRFLSSFLLTLFKMGDVGKAFQWYRHHMTTKAGYSVTSKHNSKKTTKVESTVNSISMYGFWAQRIDWTIEPISGDLNPFDPVLVSHTLLRLCVASLFGDGGSTLIASDLDLVSTCLVMVNYEAESWYATMAEPMVLVAGMNYLADQNPSALMDYFAARFFAPMNAPNMSAQERGNHMELIIAIRFLQGWWLEADLKAFLPKWVRALDIAKPVGLLDCRSKRGVSNIFLEQLSDDTFPWVTCPPVNAGPDLRYNVFSCHVKTTSTPRSKSTMYVPVGDCLKNIATMNPVNWYSSQTSAYRSCLAEVKKPGRRFVFLRFELPDTAPKLKKKFRSGAVGNDHVICVNLESEFAKKFFGINFVTAYNKFVQREIREFSNNSSANRWAITKLAKK